MLIAGKFAKIANSFFYLLRSDDDAIKIGFTERQFAGIHNTAF
jgi:hypothetical protein